MPALRCCWKAVFAWCWISFQITLESRVCLALEIISNHRPLNPRPKTRCASVCRSKRHTNPKRQTLNSRRERVPKQKTHKSKPPPRNLKASTLYPGPQARANVEAKDTSNLPPLADALKGGHRDIEELLLRVYKENERAAVKNNLVNCLDPVE